MSTPRWMIGIIVLTALVMASVLVPASPASASPEFGECYWYPGWEAGFYFQHEWNDETNVHAINPTTSLTYKRLNMKEIRHFLGQVL